MTVDSVTTKSISPTSEKKMLYIEVKADSGDSIDVSDDSVTNGQTLSSVDKYSVFDQTSDAETTANSSLSGTTLTIDSGQANTDNIYAITIIGDA